MKGTHWINRFITLVGTQVANDIMNSKATLYIITDKTSCVLYMSNICSDHTPANNTLKMAKVLFHHKVIQ